jgi:hypothetical protein
VVKALAYARSLHPNHLVAVYVSHEDEDREEMQNQWEEFGFETALEIVHSPYRSLVGPVARYLDDLDERWPNSVTTVVIPEFVMGKLSDPRNLLHGQSALALKAALLNRENTVVTSVPYHLASVEGGTDERSL